MAVASDPSSRRLAALTDEYVRLVLVSPPCPLTLTGSPVDEELYIHFLRHVNEPSQNSASPYGFGTILVDAPCSGLGTMSRYPEIRLRRAPEDCAALVQLQQAILDAAWVRLLPGGRLVYITCTANPAENGEQVQAFIARHDDASLVQEYEGGDWELFGEYFYGAMLRKG